MSANDLVQRLRYLFRPGTNYIGLEAADRIEALEKEAQQYADAYPLILKENERRAKRIEKLEAALRELASHDRDFRRFRFHDLRHRHAVDWLRAGLSIYELQKRLGHTSIKTTEVYTQFLPSDQERAVKGQAGTRTGTTDNKKAPRGAGGEGDLEY